MNRRFICKPEQKSDGSAVQRSKWKLSSNHSGALFNIALLFSIAFTV